MVSRILSPPPAPPVRPYPPFGVILWATSRNERYRIPLAPLCQCTTVRFQTSKSLKFYDLGVGAVKEQLGSLQVDQLHQQARDKISSLELDVGRKGPWIDEAVHLSAN